MVDARDLSLPAALVRQYSDSLLGAGNADNMAAAASSEYGSFQYRLLTRLRHHPGTSLTFKFPLLSHSVTLPPGSEKVTLL